VAGAVTLSMAVVLSVSCLAAKEMTPEEKVCCAAMGHDCGAAAVEVNCCSGEAAKVDALAPITIETLASAPLPVVVALLEMPDLVDRVSGIRHSGSQPPVRPPGIPTYLLVSTFRI
jgi:hypothetical protein